MNPKLEEKILENSIDRIEKNKNRLTTMDGYLGVSIRANNDFARQFLNPSKIGYKFVGGKIGLATCTDATILVSQEHFSQFLRLFGEYVREYHLHPDIDIKDEEYNFFTEEEKPMTYLDIYDRNEC